MIAVESGKPRKIRGFPELVGVYFSARRAGDGFPGHLYAIWDTIVM
jgi:hypothetical protein